MSEFDQLRLLLRVHTRILRTRVRTLLTRSRFMVVTLTLFLLTYMVSAYVLFSRGLEYVARLPAAGGLLTDRILHLLFFFFFVMLVFSSAITSYISLFRNRETSWLLTLPVTHRVVFLWKSFEAALFSSWGLLFISAPLILAFAHQRSVPGDFYFKTVAALIPFVIVASALASLLLLTVVRFTDRRQIAIATAVIAVVACLWGARAIGEEQALLEKTGLSAALTFQQVLRHTDVSVHPVFPSTWLTRSMLQWTPGIRARSELYPALLASYSLMGVLAVAMISRAWFYTCWNRSLQAGAIAAFRRHSRRLAHPRRRPLSSFPGFHWLRMPLVSISRKDIRAFYRDPAQWVQFLIVFSLLLFYVLNIDKMGYNIEDEKDATVIAFLNLTVCALALSTLTTRFVFPQFSLEGRKVWILAMSPLPLYRVVIQKFCLATAFTGTLVTIIVLFSGAMLNMPREDILFFVAATGLLSVGLNGLAVGLGTLFPNLKQVNAAKIVSGFGGTLCLIASFAYIVLFVSSLVYARFPLMKFGGISFGSLDDHYWILGTSLAVLATLVFTLIPMIFAMNRLKKLEILGKL